MTSTDEESSTPPPPLPVPESTPKPSNPTNPSPSENKESPNAPPKTGKAKSGGPKREGDLYGRPSYRPNWDPRPWQNADFAALNNASSPAELPSYLKHARCVCREDFDAWWKCVKQNRLGSRPFAPTDPCANPDARIRGCMSAASVIVGQQVGAVSSEWRENATPDGRRYYYNPSTRTSSVSQPPEYAEADRRMHKALAAVYKATLKDCSDVNSTEPVV